MDAIDIAFVGSGIATTVTLTALFTKILEQEDNTKKLTIAVIEKNKELWLGVPYGSRSSVNALSITHVHDFIYEKERPQFFEWFKANKDNWTAYYQEQGGATAERWLNNNLPLIENEDWENIYIPRFILGKYILEKFNGLLKAVTEKGLVALTTIHGTVSDVRPVHDGVHEITIANEGDFFSTVVTHKPVISIGSPPVRRMYDNAGNDITYINDIYEPSADKNFAALRKVLSNTDNKEDRNVLLIGSNASAIELLYLLEGMGEVRKLINQLIVISPSGQLPYHISTEALEQHPTPSLDRLHKEGNYTLEVLMDATSSDLTLAVKDGANVGYIATIINNTLALLQELGDEAKKRFIGIYGMKLSGMFRRSGPEYKQASQLLIDMQEVILLKGKFIRALPAKNGVTLSYLDTMTQQEASYPLSFKAIINCSGSEDLQSSSSQLIHSLIDNYHCQINLSNKGFEVNQNFEAAPELYIMGPLLGGNMNKLIHFWHLENAPRLMYLAPYLAGVLLEAAAVTSVP